jgi:uncharacterized protein with von Willebrand factor type A (vWA) domain
VQADSPVQRRTSRRAGPGATPLRRRPKQLDAEPQLLEPSRSGAGGLVLGNRNGRAARRSGSGGPAITAEQGTLTAPGAAPVDPETVRRARQIATRLAMPRPRRDTTARRGIGELASLRYRDGSDDIDLDRTVEQLIEHPLPDEDDIIVRERVRTRRSVLLLADVSGSMRG